MPKLTEPEYSAVDEIINAACATLTDEQAMRDDWRLVAHEIANRCVALDERVAELEDLTDILNCAEIDMIGQRDALAAQLKRVETSHDEVNKMHDALAKRLDAVIAWCTERDTRLSFDDFHDGICEAAKEVLRLARGEDRDAE